MSRTKKKTSQAPTALETNPAISDVMLFAERIVKYFEKEGKGNPTTYTVIHSPKLPGVCLLRQANDKRNVEVVSDPKLCRAEPRDLPTALCGEVAVYRGFAKDNVGDQFIGITQMFRVVDHGKVHDYVHLDRDDIVTLPFADFHAAANAIATA